MVKVHAKAKEDEKQDENKPDDWCWIEAAVHHYLLLASFRIETSICFDPCIYYSPRESSTIFNFPQCPEYS